MVNIDKKIKFGAVISTLVLSSVFSFAIYNSIHNMQNSNAVELPGVFNILSPSKAEAAISNVPDPLIGAAFKKVALEQNPNMPNVNFSGNIPQNIPKPPTNIPNMPSNPTNAPKNPEVKGIILPNIAILAQGGKTSVVKLSTTSPFGYIDEITEDGVIIDGKLIVYRRGN